MPCMSFKNNTLLSYPSQIGMKGNSNHIAEQTLCYNIKDQCKVLNKIIKHNTT